MAAQAAIIPFASPPAATPPKRVVGDAELAIVTGILREFAQYQVWKNPYSMQCEETASLILPTSRNTFFYQSFNWPGAKKTQQQVDATGMLALTRFCAIADSLVTPRNMQWHGLQGDPYVMKDRASRLWFENTTAALFRLRYAANANFQAQNYSNWQGVGAFGNAVTYIDSFDGRWHHGLRGFRYKAVPFGECFFGENHQGKVDRIIRWFRMTPYQAVQKWGRAALPEQLETPLQADSQWPYNFLHCVRPRGDDYDPERLDAKGLPFASYYVSIEGRCLMQPERGYRVFPYAVSRYDQAPGEVYGRGPAQLALPSLKTLNAQKTTFLKQGHRAADPILLTADDGVVGMSQRPGAINKGGVTADGKLLVHILPTGDIQISEKMMGEERAIIDDLFFVTIMKTLVDNPNMTATQVIQLVNERGMLVAPPLGRQHTELVGGMVERELDLAANMRLLDPMPPRLREAMGEYEVTDTSPLALMAKTGEAAGFMRVVENVRELVNVTQDQSLLDPFDFPTAIPDIARSMQVPERWMADEKKQQQKAQARAQAAQRQEAIQAAPAQAALQSAAAKQFQAGMLGGQGGGVPA